MKNSRRLPGVLCLSFILLLCFTSSPDCQIVPHHTFLVNNDAPSSECLSCHDGVLNKHLPFCTGKCGFRDPHIIDIMYPPPDDIFAYRPPEFVMGIGIRLPHGLVTCISCHNLLNPMGYHLAVSNQGSMLCLACHNM